MELVSTPRIDFLRDLALEVLARYGRGRMIVSIDGPLLSGKTEFARDFAAVCEEAGHDVFQAHLEDFHRSRAQQADYGADTAERYYRFGFDYSTLNRVLLDPYRFGGSTGFVTRAFDPSRDSWVEPKWVTGPADAILIIDGRFANRPQLTDRWDYRIVLDAPLHDDADRLYYETVLPLRKADAIIDNTNPDAPKRIFADYC